ncbi:hypothetical protein V7793_06170 [Streptomyces sp. KLMMK]|uniref:hypothetical protein n=1 Tax=Streptomyces sp. KLMMK TaxID=3109353 RepID=UPI002FFEA4F6
MIYSRAWPAQAAQVNVVTCAVLLSGLLHASFRPSRRASTVSASSAREGMRAMGWGTGKGDSGGDGQHSGGKDFSDHKASDDTKDPKSEPKHKKDDK